MTLKVLMTGFDPFGEDLINPSLEAVKLLHGRTIQGLMIVAEQIPTVFNESIHVLIDAINRHRPDVVIAVGQAGGRTEITPERIAINIDDARIPDNCNHQPIDEPVVEDGPAAYWSTLPIKRIVHEMRKAGIPAAVSNTAGTFVCNHLFYGLMDYLSNNAPHIKGGFIHIPYLPEQTMNNNAPSLSLELIVKGLEIAVLASSKAEKDMVEAGGTTH